MSLATGFQGGSLDSVRLQEFVEVLPIAPASAVIVEMEMTVFGLADDRKAPVWKLDAPARHGTGEELMSSVDGRRKLPPAAGRGNGRRITDLCLNLDDV